MSSAAVMIGALRINVNGSTFKKSNSAIFIFASLFNRGVFLKKRITVQILCIGTDRSQQTVQTKIRLLLKKQSDQGLHCLPFHQHLLDAFMQCYIKFFYF